MWLDMWPQSTELRQQIHRNVHFVAFHQLRLPLKSFPSTNANSNECLRHIIAYRFPITYIHHVYRLLLVLVCKWCCSHLHTHIKKSHLNDNNNKIDVRFIFRSLRFYSESVFLVAGNSIQIKQVETWKPGMNTKKCFNGFQSNWWKTMYNKAHGKL